MSRAVKDLKGYQKSYFTMSIRTRQTIATCNIIATIMPTHVLATLIAAISYFLPDNASYRV
jgi:hypothetical protein